MRRLKVSELGEHGVSVVPQVSLRLKSTSDTRKCTTGVQRCRVRSIYVYIYIFSLEFARLGSARPVKFINLASRGTKLHLLLSLK